MIAPALTLACLRRKVKLGESQRVVPLGLLAAYANKYSFLTARGGSE